MKTILVFSHNHNTFDKKKLLENMHPDFCKISPKRIEDFIRCSPLEDNIKKFFIEDIDEMLKLYLPGQPAMKPDVLEGIKKIEKEREELARKQMEEQDANNSGKIMLQREGMPPMELQPFQIIELLQQNQNQMQQMMNKINEQEKMIQNLQKLLLARGNVSQRNIVKCNEVKETDSESNINIDLSEQPLEKYRNLEKPPSKLEPNIWKTD